MTSSSSGTSSSRGARHAVPGLEDSLTADLRRLVSSSELHRLCAASASDRPAAPATSGQSCSMCSWPLGTETQQVSLHSAFLTLVLRAFRCNRPPCASRLTCFMRTCGVLNRLWQLATRALPASICHRRTYANGGWNSSSLRASLPQPVAKATAQLQLRALARRAGRGIQLRGIRRELIRLLPPKDNTGLWSTLRFQVCIAVLPRLRPPRLPARTALPRSQGYPVRLIRWPPPRQSKAPRMIWPCWWRTSETHTGFGPFKTAWRTRR